jgi:hypothetical protein
MRLRPRVSVLEHPFLLGVTPHRLALEPAAPEPTLEVLDVPNLVG